MEETEGKFAQEKKRILVAATQAMFESLKLKNKTHEVLVQSVIDLAFEAGRLVEMKEIYDVHFKPKPSWFSRLFQ